MVMPSWDKPLTWMTSKDWVKIKVIDDSFHLLPPAMALVLKTCPHSQGKLCLIARLRKKTGCRVNSPCECHSCAVTLINGLISPAKFSICEMGITKPSSP